MERYFIHNLQEYEKESEVQCKQLVFVEKQRGFCIQQIVSRYVPSKEEDFSIFSGSAGTSYMMLHLYLLEKKEEWLRHCVGYLKVALAFIEESRESLREATFLTGCVGVYALASVVYDLQGKKTKSEKYHKKVQRCEDHVGSDQMDSDEIVYGRAGYVQALLFLYQHKKDVTLLEIADRVIQIIIISGKEMAQSRGSTCPLMFKWHEKRYLGAAHGLAGILHIMLKTYSMLLEVTQDDKKKEEIKGNLQMVKECIHYLIGQKDSDCNYPSSLGKKGENELVQWCHGAPGIILLLCKAYEIYQDANLLQEAKAAAEVVWKRGLLRKGFGLCHGICGNAYSFLKLFQITKDPQYEHYAFQFSEFAWEDSPLTHQLISTPSSPYSLFLGIAGAVCFYTDLLLSHNGHSIEFPTF